MFDEVLGTDRLTARTSKSIRESDSAVSDLNHKQEIGHLSCADKMLKRLLRINNLCHDNVSKQWPAYPVFISACTAANFQNKTTLFLKDSNFSQVAIVETRRMVPLNLLNQPTIHIGNACEKCPTVPSTL